jgi:hypothetical protein
MPQGLARQVAPCPRGTEHVPAGIYQANKVEGDQSRLSRSGRELDQKPALALFFLCPPR